MRPSGTVVLVSLCVTGCARSPSVNVLGAYFPDWLFCIVAGVLITIAFRVVAQRTHHERWFGAPAVVYPAVGFPTVKAILANRIAPGLIDKYLASAGYEGQLTDVALAADAPTNLYEPVPGNYGAHGRFDRESKTGSLEMFTDRHRSAVWLLAAVGLVGGIHFLAKKYSV